MPPSQNHQHTHGRRTLLLRGHSQPRRRRSLSADGKSRLRRAQVSTGYSPKRISHSVNDRFAFLISPPIAVRHQQTRRRDDGLSNAPVFLCAGCLRASIISNGHSFENILVFAFPVLSTQQRSGKQRWAVNIAGWEESSSLMGPRGHGRTIPVSFSPLLVCSTAALVSSTCEAALPCDLN